MMTSDRWLTLNESAGYSKLSRSKLYRMVQDGDVPASRIASQWRSDSREVDKWMKSQREGGSASQGNKNGNDGQINEESF